MSFLIPPDQRTNEGPYSLASETRPLSTLEHLYAEMMLQVSLMEAWEEELALTAAAEPSENLLESGVNGLFPPTPVPHALGETKIFLTEPKSIFHA